MHGNGTKPGITANRPPPARLLDLTRLISRAGRHLTGVDRVELAYLKALAQDPVPLFGLVRTTLGFVLLGPEGCTEILARLENRTPWGVLDWVSIAARRKRKSVRRAESDLRRLALRRALPSGLGQMLRRHLPVGTAYLNVGHSNLTENLLAGVRSLKGQITVLLHDAIPLEFPQFQREGMAERFQGMLNRVQAHADLIIYNSEDTKRRIEIWMAGTGACPDGVVAHLGVPIPEIDRSSLPANLPLDRSYFVAVGTIEPRKRHDLLLDAWEDMIAEMPPETVPGLLICGGRGWNNSEVFDRLDALPEGGPVYELSGLSDGALAAVMQGSEALLCPSEAEGFGLPQVEAVALGVPVVCRDLQVYHEILDDIPVYLEETDRYQLRNAVESLIKGQTGQMRAVPDPGFAIPAWRDHFNTVLSLT